MDNKEHGYTGYMKQKNNKVKQKNKNVKQQTEK